jgi:ABC-type lipoprotein export system ATPase subunit
MDKKPVIELTEVEKHYSQGAEVVRAVDKITLTVEAGDFLTITGRSGSGKTTLLSLIGGLTEPTSGNVRIFGEPIAELDDAALSTLRAGRVGFAFQFASLIPTLNALDNVRLPGLFANKPIGPDGAGRLLTWVGLSDKTKNFPSQLSGGQQARVALARSLANHPDLLLADEPTGNLDVDTENEIMVLFREININEGITIVLVTHNPQLAKFGNRHLIMDSGRLTEKPLPIPEGMKANV